MKKYITRSTLVASLFLISLSQVSCQNSEKKSEGNEVALAADYPEGKSPEVWKEKLRKIKSLY